MQEWLGEAEAARLVPEAVEGILGEGQVRTRDLGATASTSEMGDALGARIEKLAR